MIQLIMNLTVKKLIRAMPLILRASLTDRVRVNIKSIESAEIIRSRNWAQKRIKMLIIMKIIILIIIVIIIIIIKISFLKLKRDKVARNSLVLLIMNKSKIIELNIFYFFFEFFVFYNFKKYLKKK